jgi:hypothetical protein
MGRTASASGLEKVSLAPIVYADAELTVVSPQGEQRVYGPADLERFTTYRVVTTTPWRSEPATFEGVLLADVLAASDLSDVESILVTAENDFSTSLSRELIADVDILVATRVNGAAISRRARGPIQFVIDAQAFRSSRLTAESNLVWMAARIEAGE